MHENAASKSYNLHENACWCFAAPRSDVAAGLVDFRDPYFKAALPYTEADGKFRLSS